MTRQSDWRTKLARWEARPTRWTRRWMLLGALVTPAVFYAMAIFTLYPFRDHGVLYGVASFINVLSAMGIGLFYLHFVRRTFSTLSLDDRAQLDYGRAFDQLTEMQRDRIRWAMQHELKEGDRVPDEREAAMQRYAEGRAFWVLQRGLPVLVVVYWAVCLSLSTGTMRMGLLFSAVAISGLSLVVLALPEAIRIWMMPDEVGEPKVVKREA